LSFRQPVINRFAISAIRQMGSRPRFFLIARLFATSDNEAASSVAWLF
jgi:hypothetical protein